MSGGPLHWAHQEGGFRKGRWSVAARPRRTGGGGALPATVAKTRPAALPPRGGRSNGPYTDSPPLSDHFQGRGVAGSGGGVWGGGGKGGLGRGGGGVWVGLDSSGFRATDPGRDGSSVSGATINEVIDTAWAREHASKFHLFSSCAAAPARCTTIDPSHGQVTDAGWSMCRQLRAAACDLVLWRLSVAPPLPRRAWSAPDAWAATPRALPTRACHRVVLAHTLGEAPCGPCRRAGGWGGCQERGGGGRLHTLPRKGMGAGSILDKYGIR